MDIKKTVKQFINEKLIENLLMAHKELAERGSVKPLIILTKFIFRLSKQFDTEIMYFSVDENNDL